MGLLATGYLFVDKRFQMRVFVAPDSVADQLLCSLHKQKAAPTKQRKAQQILGIF